MFVLAESPVSRFSGAAMLSPMKKYFASVLFLALCALVSSRAAGLNCFEPDDASGSSLAVAVDAAPLVHTAQVFAMNPSGKITSPKDARRQTEAVLEKLDQLLHTADSSLSRAAKLNVYLARDLDLLAVRAALAAKFSGHFKPAVSFVTGALAEPETLVAMDAVATTTTGKDGKFRLPAALPGGIAPIAVLPAGPKLYVSGMADTNSLLPATRATLEKLVACIGHLGSKPEDIVQLKVFLQPMSEIVAVRKVVADYFGGKAPPTVFVDWISASPVVEIEMIAAAHGDVSKETNSVSYFTPPGTTDSKVYRRVARVNYGRLVYVSGLYGEKASDGASQIREIFSKLGMATKQASSDFEHLVKATYYVTDNDASDKLNSLRPEYYNPQRPPAASKAKVQGVGLAGKTVTMDMIAVTK